MARRRANPATAAARLVTLAETALRAVALLAPRVDPRSVTSVARSVTLRATAPMRTARPATEVEASMAAATMVEDRPARRATLVAASVTCRASASMAVSATTVVRTATSLAIALRLLPEARKSAISVSSPDTSKLSVLTKLIDDLPPRPPLMQRFNEFLPHFFLASAVYKGGW
ncbi:hypothetical protein F5Y06DRAFT_258179 [Hypoxylon sp. FL0890]|nr:hypothetical protein F5Y06DRAFT_258179 [Hypoxylon sp. FL0890]